MTNYKVSSQEVGSIRRTVMNAAMALRALGSRPEAKACAAEKVSADMLIHSAKRPARGGAVNEVLRARAPWWAQ